MGVCVVDGKREVVWVLFGVVGEVDDSYLYFIYGQLGFIGEYMLDSLDTTLRLGTWCVVVHIHVILHSVFSSNGRPWSRAGPICAA